ncbi:hypothetical protein [Aerosakkonema funiforme]
MVENVYQYYIFGDGGLRHGNLTVGGKHLIYRPCLSDPTIRVDLTS